MKSRLIRIFDETKLSSPSASCSAGQPLIPKARAYGAMTIRMVNSCSMSQSSFSVTRQRMPLSDRRVLFARF